ncbi:DUF5615 family PIN-like protein [Cronbergia sp. UHCC 0137]|uniref:DUF5615 family PIN-like protein n=1 Tax=Cronbergia sp. UHCC 0137 TaxID=3110239 RepID=UPI002B1F38D1|nr:DUF5615 family PIN-like protein [Cronbergia sp. UHCC 0137]MEA5617575.1 DUF5615 family PIN-like protein [Cronbergia sp. UHCC 0137]
MKLLFDHNLSPNLVNYWADLYPNSNHLYLMQLDQESDYTVWEIAKIQGYAMITKQIIQEKLESLTPEELNQVYELIQNLSSAERPVKEPSLMSK